MTLPHIPETPENGETPKPTWPDGSLMMDATARHLERGGFLPHIPESEKRQKEPEMGVSVDAEKHPDYPIRHGVPAMDRCICGGVRHWHAPDGCDDCDCRGFVLDENWRP